MYNVYNEIFTFQMQPNFIHCILHMYSRYIYTYIVLVNADRNDFDWLLASSKTFHFDFVNRKLMTDWSWSS